MSKGEFVNYYNPKVVAQQRGGGGGENKARENMNINNN